MDVHIRRIVHVKTYSYLTTEEELECVPLRGDALDPVDRFSAKRISVALSFKKTKTPKRCNTKTGQSLTMQCF